MFSGINTQGRHPNHARARALLALLALALAVCASLSPWACAAAAQSPAAAPAPFSRAGIAFDGSAPLSMSYPAALQGDETVTYGALEVLVADRNGSAYRRFVTEYDHQVYVYPETAAGTFVLSVHDGTLRLPGRALEAEPLRRLIEGPLYRTYSLETIEANLAALIGRSFRFENDGRAASFTLTQARRMSADAVADFLYRPMELSLFMEPLDAPERSFLMLICSGRQPGEPWRTFAGRYVFVLEADGPDAPPPVRVARDTPR